MPLTVVTTTFLSQQLLGLLLLAEVVEGGPPAPRLPPRAEILPRIRHGQRLVHQVEAATQVDFRLPRVLHLLQPVVHDAAHALAAVGGEGEAVHVLARADAGGDAGQQRARLNRKREGSTSLLCCYQQAAQVTNTFLLSNSTQREASTVLLWNFLLVMQPVGLMLP